MMRCRFSPHPFSSGKTHPLSQMNQTLQLKNPRKMMLFISSDFPPAKTPEASELAQLKGSSKSSAQSAHNVDEYKQILFCIIIGCISVPKAKI